MKQIKKNIGMDLQPFTHPKFGAIYIIMIDNEPWFLLKNVCESIKLTSRGVKQRLADSQMIKRPILDAIGRSRLTTFINEAGLYNAILDSRKPEAREFRNWVVGEVLPAIRKHGAYVHATNDDTPETINAKAQQAAQMAIDHLRRQLQDKEQEIEAKDLELAAQDLRIAEQELQLEAQAPKVNYANALLVLPHACSVATFAKIITQSGYARFGQNTLYKWLRDRHYLGSKGLYRNLPLQEYQQQGLFVIREKPGVTYYGTFTVNYTTYVTPKGQQYFLDLFHRLNTNARR